VGQDQNLAKREFGLKETQKLILIYFSDLKKYVVQVVKVCICGYQF